MSHSKLPQEQQEYYKKTALTALTGFGILALAASRFKVASANEMLVKTGLGLNQKLSLSRSTVAWPFQKVTPISISPWTVSSNIQGMSHERIPFKLPVVITVGPNTENYESLKLYAEKLSQKDPEEIRELVKHIISGDARIIAASMTANQLFHERDTFKKQVSDGVQESLKDLGLKVINANLEELTDEPGASYFEQQRKRALADVQAEAIVQVALAQRVGEVGSKDQEMQRRIQTAAFEALSQLQENSRQLEISRSQADLEVARAELHRQSAIASAQAEADIEQTTLKLQQEIQRQRAMQETERLRAEELTDKIVQAEKLVRETTGQSDSDFIVASNQARMQLIAVEAQAKATRMEADAKFYAQQQQAQGTIELGNADAKAMLAKLNTEAEGRLAMLRAEAQGLDELVKAAGGSEAYLAQSMIKERTLPQIAEAQATAVRDMKPIIWNQTQGSGQGIVAALANDLPPYFDGLKHLTGLDVTGFLKEKMRQPTVVDHK